MYVQLSLARDYCNAISAEEVSDVVLQLLIDAAEARVEAYLNRPLSEILDPVAPPVVPDPVQTAGAAVRLGILKWVVDEVDNKGTFVVGTISGEMPNTVERLLYPYRLGLGV
jgi:hypothetical protein